MKYLIIFTLSSFFAFSQTKEIANKNTYPFLRYVLDKKATTLYIKESPNKSWLSECKVWENSKILKADEIRAVNIELKEKLKTAIQTTEKFKIISDSVFDNSDKDELVKEKNPIVIISKPIFLRDGKFCVFFFQIVCGNICGQSSLALYKKRGKRWVKKEEFCSFMN